MKEVIAAIVFVVLLVGIYIASVVGTGIYCFKLGKRVMAQEVIDMFTKARQEESLKEKYGSTY